MKIYFLVFFLFNSITLFSQTLKFSDLEKILFASPADAEEELFKHGYLFDKKEIVEFDQQLQYDFKINEKSASLFRLVSKGI